MQEIYETKELNNKNMKIEQQVALAKVRAATTWTQTYINGKVEGLQKYANTLLECHQQFYTFK